MNWIISVIIISSILALISIWLEYRRSNRRYLVWRILACIIAIGALACLVLPITYQSQTQIMKGDNNAVLLTEGYTKDSISNNYKFIFTTDKAIKEAYPKAVLLSGLEEVAQHRSAIKNLYILGYGLSTDELKTLSHVATTYTAPKIPAGIQTIDWQGKLKAGEQLQVQGRFNNTASKSVKLVLKGLNTGLDSVNIAANQTADFELATHTKSTGRQTFNLIGISGSDTITNETLPFIIEPAKPVKVLMLSAAPNFETNFLKNWLSSNGYAVAARAVISKDKISQDFVNMNKLPLDRLTSNLLAQFDAVIGDLSALKTLGGPESAALKQQVTLNGLGVIVRADSADKNASWLQQDFAITTVAAKGQLTTALRLQNQQAKTAVLNVDPSYINSRSNTQNLVYDTQNHILASSAMAGAGRIAFTTLNHTYTWMLAGNGKDYSALWSLLIGKAVRKAAPMANWQIASATPSVSESVKLEYQGTALTSSITIDQSVLAPQQNRFVPYSWSVTYWPNQIGWQQVRTGGNTSALWYTYAKSNWNSLKILKKIADTKNYIENQPKINSVTKQIQQTAKVEVPKFYFYLILLIACSFLWIERKLAI
ncbi:hypothetical protein [Mucilaginibacter lacusdianchii]|uniref:hypothetical protein n=1 Tax=Mucilaginibacter lacusdianchii TaxID=2684211 RepID=UPI00131CFA7A|nr:hypothetical protein [Mucilaginibacter sp. JXJ CY 39]